MGSANPARRTVFRAPRLTRFFTFGVRGAYVFRLRGAMAAVSGGIRAQQAGWNGMGRGLGVARPAQDRRSSHPVALAAVFLRSDAGQHRL